MNCDFSISDYSIKSADLCRVLNPNFKLFKKRTCSSSFRVLDFVHGNNGVNVKTHRESDVRRQLGNAL